MTPSDLLLIFVLAAAAVSGTLLALELLGWIDDERKS
jgi:hypothetical protein